MSLFSFLRGEKDIFDKYSSFIIFSIYSSKIEAFLVSKKEKLLIENVGVEFQEGMFVDGKLDMEKLKLNCAKLKVKISEKNIRSKNIIFGLSSEILKPVFISRSVKRPDKEKKIEAAEFDKMTSEIRKEFTDKDRSIRLGDIEKYLIDGYSIRDPDGLRGEDLKIELIGFEYQKELYKTLGLLANFLAFDLFGVFALDSVLLLAEREFKNIEDVVFINILKNHISLFLVRKGFVTAIDNLTEGYGSFEKKISQDLGVGLQEARGIKNKFVDGNLDVEIMEKLRALAMSESQSILNRVRAVLMSLDPVDLLPKTVFLSFSGKPPLQLEQAFKKGNNWFSDLPFPQDVDIIFLNTIDMSAIINKSLSLSETNKNMYTNALVNAILKNTKYK